MPNPRRTAMRNPRGIAMRNPRGIAMRILRCGAPRILGRGAPCTSLPRRLPGRASFRAAYELTLQKAVLSGRMKKRYPRFCRDLRRKNCAGERGSRSRGRVDTAPAHTVGGCSHVHGRSRALAHVLALEDCDHSCSYHHIDICCGPYYYLASGGGERCP